MQSPERVRIDKWLWAARLFKSRTTAADACSAGHVKINGLKVKPSRDIHIGEILTALTGRIQRTVKVRALTEQRMGAKALDDCLEDLTPAEEYERAREQSAPATPRYPKGRGRPTKKDRRLLERLMD